MNEYETSTDPSPSTKVVEAVADELDVEPIELETPLAEAIETDALDHLFKGPGDSVVISFSYYGYRVTVEEDGDVTLTENSE
ncbi:HalOD1 output domain-containing protein [Natrialbaceae archaeon AArc-T1-2]|uniref:HalOD1 output domain-containing protein n=1 Tax=Natrialbaceae archaeon AArc-T1-2 TaxID=3053904 RepID=UPI00255B2A39|nr:HalOD1 output domain-containing protein [Natrialbaceae archaeon AArc-T1-2]WIV67371.1 hypothetical protein QQ977_01185 [Natrialbaceae archaeon AArc-T1-2]